ncbi:acetylglutamate kinase [Alicyclobacillus dauci]|uniref:acetylglutamate kinase n=1 Tax=Alicyclobacillus dauci TaxID=1475485 RepID=A0ABY6YY68_9BACL|nr:acetylglutamate kinase [Alicyclobacillus dauci]WAH35565.1 acetylglutamate kinase [Alicyclobacillus dauci]
MRIVMKIGGALDGAGERQLRLALATCRSLQHEVIVVHGGGPEISRRLAQAGIELPFVDGLRLTTTEAMPIVEAALRTCNERLAGQLACDGVRFLPMIDDTVVGARDTGHLQTGDVSHVHSNPLLNAWTEGLIPLLPPYGRDGEGRLFNLNADTVAAHVARALCADKLIFCTNVSGVFADFAAGEQLFDVTVEKLKDHVSSGSFSAGMIPKVTAMLYAAAHGIRETWVVDGSDGQSLDYAIRRAALDADTTRSCYGTCLIANPTYTEVHE